MTTSRKVTDTQLREWEYTNFPYKLIAAAIARWAADRERYTILPDDRSFGIEASPSTFKRAKLFLVGQGVLITQDGPFQVALRPGGQRSRATSPRLILWDNGFHDRH
ncbi:MAG TPA: hypothetical protein VMU95_00090 [Trebonia sp.]|nr:hypothetical protein [Trebonia sp.]